jgi:alpha-galactosidase
MKIAIIGAGSYVFTPSVIEDILIKCRFDGAEFAMVDVNRHSAELMAGLAKAVSSHLGLSCKTYHYTNREDALVGADFVMTCVAIQGKKRWQTDYDICYDEGIPHLVRENGSLGGLVYGFRASTLMLEIARDMERLCPNALLLNVSNPLTRVLTTIRKHTKIKAYGFCSVALCGATGFERVARLTNRKIDEINVISAGLNHFSWLISAKDASDVDILPIMLANEQEIYRTWFRQYGMIASPPVDHHFNFIPTHPDLHYPNHPPFHGTDAERNAMTAELEAVSNGTKAYYDSAVFKYGSWEHPGLVAVAITRNEELYLPALNMPNNGNIPQLPNGTIVEIPAHVSNGSIVGETDIILHDKVVGVLCQQAELNEMAAEAVVSGDRELVHKIIDFDGAIDNKFVAHRAVERMLDAHLDLMPQFG